MSATSAVPAAVPSVTHSSIAMHSVIGGEHRCPLPSAVMRPGKELRGTPRVDVRDERGAAGNRHRCCAHRH